MLGFRSLLGGLTLSKVHPLTYLIRSRYRSPFLDQFPQSPSARVSTDPESGSFRRARCLSPRILFVQSRRQSSHHQDMLKNTVTSSREGKTALTPACKGSLFHLEINGREPPLFTKVGSSDRYTPCPRVGRKGWFKARSPRADMYIHIAHRLFQKAIS